MTGPPQYEALPATYVDLIRDGVPAAELKERGNRAVAAALKRTAMSALNHGWHRVDWEGLLFDPRSRLGWQATRDSDGRPLGAAARLKLLDWAWRTADEYIENNPRSGRERALDTAAAHAALLGDPRCRLDDNQRAVLAHAVSESRRLGTDRVALPVGRGRDATGLGLTAWRTAIRRLGESGLLTLAIPGRPGNPARPGNKPRANCYRLAAPAALDAYLQRETRSVVPSPTPVDQVCDAPPALRLVEPQVCDAPTARQARPRTAAARKSTERRATPTGGLVQLSVEATSEAADLVLQLLRHLDGVQAVATAEGGGETTIERAG